MAEIKLLQIDLTLDGDAFSGGSTTIKNGESFTYEINENFETLGYDTQPSFVDKQFIFSDRTDAIKVASFENDSFRGELGGFNGSVFTLEVFEINGETLLAFGGQFTEYVKDGVTTDCKCFIILQEDGQVYLPNDIDYDTLIDEDSGINERVQSIKYHEINNSLIIGGRFSAGRINNLFELDLATNTYSSRMSNWGLSGSINRITNGVKDIDVRQNNGTIAIVGDFEEVLGEESKYLTLLSKDFTLASGVFYNRTKDIVEDGDRLNKVRLSQTGDFSILLCGLFTYTNSLVSRDDGSQIQNILSLNSLGAVNKNTDFKNTDSDLTSGEVKDILEFNNQLYFAGSFETYGTETVNGLFRTNINGVLDNGFNIGISNISLESVARGQGNSIHIGINSISSNNFYRINLDTNNITNNLKFQTPPLFIKFYEGITYTGGGFNYFDVEPTNLEDNQIRVLTDISQTRDNIFDNLVANNTREGDLGFRYSKVGADIVRITKIIEEDEQIYFVDKIKNLSNKLTVTVSRNDASLVDNIVNIPIRKDFYLKSPDRLIWSNASFKFSVFESGAFNLENKENTVEIIKQKISDAQLNQFINISPLIDKNIFESDIQNYKDFDYGEDTAVLNNLSTGKFSGISSSILLNSTVLETKGNVAFLIDSYNNIKPILQSGNKRNFNNQGVLTVPFLSSVIKEIKIINGFEEDVILNSGFNNTNPQSPENYISFLAIDFSKYYFNSKIVLEFYGTEELIDTVTLFKANTSALFNTFKVIFKNSFGVLETTYMGGRSIDSVSTDSSNYKRDTRNINGNVQNELRHRNKTYNKVGEREWECNTGLVDAYMNDCYEDLFMSEEVWLEYEGELKAVSLEESNFNKEDNLQTDMINYSFRFKEDIKINE